MKKLTPLAAAIVALAFTFSPAHAAKPKTPPAPAAPATEEEKTLYSLGVLLSHSLSTFELTPAELALVQRGVQDSISGSKLPFNAEEYLPKIQEMQKTRMAAGAVKAAAAGVAFLESAASEPGATKTASGMVIKQTQEGTGVVPIATDQVKVHYEGKLISGKVFDSSIARGEPVTFPLNGVIPCWTEGVQTMKVGGKAHFVCPASLAYGAQGSPPTIPPESTLVFDVELLEIVKPAP
jgi:FKBP-type peptidyl-prolyl cis-trans isomerase FkpA